MVPRKSFTFVMNKLKKIKKNLFEFEIQGQDQFCGRFCTRYFHQIEDVEFINFPFHPVYWPITVQSRNSGVLNISKKQLF